MRWTFDFSSSTSSARQHFSSLNFLFCCSFLASHRHNGNVPANISLRKSTDTYKTTATKNNKETHTHTQTFNGRSSGTTRVGQYQKKHSPTHTHPDHWTSFINFLHLLRSIASFSFSLRAWQSFLTTSLQVLFGLHLGLGSSTLYIMLFFTQSSSFRSKCPYHRSLFCCNTNAMSSIPNLSLSSLEICLLA